ncbi:hypothetical protein KIPE111705_19195 [Kibdelosporangium persicum]|uniref:Uncharacterized protein n=1 Tax=Kibdelosporangium persicum TaxID=2698649 RepID=A0ABX2FAD3_9PSEU|nr:hypothetical protein [Kibdelosporangium persicum]NRN68333.1 hypothetical protein [Kibdelosporangium persicum]
MRKSIKVMAGYQCSPLWLTGSNGGGNLSVYELPISDTLAGELWEWAGIYDGTLDRDPRSSGFSTEEAGRRFVERGAELAKKLAAELGDGYVVSYFDNTTMTERPISM